MSALNYGELFAGYDGLGMGVRQVLGGETAWVSEVAAAPSKILGHNLPGVPNIGDVTKVDWRAVAPVDVLTGGSPCQDLSNAGARAGMTTGTRSNLWVEMREAVNVLRPRLVVWENVRGALSARAASAMEPCPGCVGDAGQRGAVLRALGRVVGDLADLGYDARWYGLRAADVGGAHGRFRVFLFATPADTDHAGWGEHGRTVAVQPQQSAAQRSSDPVLTLLPTPAVNDMGEGKTLDWWDEWAPRQKSATGAPAPHGKSLAIEAQRLLPSAVQTAHWGNYGAAIARAEVAVGRPAPAPTFAGKLSPVFVEWLMMLPAGHVTDVPGVSRTDALKALGNGVVPAQAAAATRAFLADVRRERIAA